MSPVLYHFAPSAPSRSALLTARALGLDIEVKIVDLFAKEQLKENFTKINPQHCVPTLDDTGFVLWESRAIAAYLVTKYGKDDTLYPANDAKKRATVDSLLYFDAGTMYPRIRAICFPVLFLGEKTIGADKKEKLNEALGFLETFLQVNKWLAGDNFTIADIANVASVSSILAVGWSLKDFPNVAKWVTNCASTIPGYDENKQGAELFGSRVRSKLNPGEI